MPHDENAGDSGPEIADQPNMDGFVHSVGFWEGIDEDLQQIERGEVYTLEEVRQHLKDVLQHRKEWVQK